MGRVPGNFAEIKEREGAASGDYPPEWPDVAHEVKEAASWKCERCGHPHDPENGFALTVHHLDGNKWNLERWNLAALCQRCHLSVQGKVDFYQDSLNGEHREWMAKHVADYNLWAEKNGQLKLSLEKIVKNRDSYW